MTTLIKTTTALASTALVAVAFAAPAAAEKWDMPLAYSASNFHSENAAVFAAHSSLSWFKYLVSSAMACSVAALSPEALAKSCSA